MAKSQVKTVSVKKGSLTAGSLASRINKSNQFGRRITSGSRVPSGPKSTLNSPKSIPNKPGTIKVSIGTGRSLADVMRNDSKKSVASSKKPASSKSGNVLSSLRKLQAKNDAFTKSKDAKARIHGQGENGVPKGPKALQSNSSRPAASGKPTGTPKAGSQQRNTNQSSANSKHTVISSLTEIEVTDPSFSFKHASLPPILRLANLVNGTSAADVKAVLSQIGRVLDCRIKLESNNTITAEAIFEQSDHASIGASRFDNSIADGQPIRAIVTKGGSIPGLGAGFLSGASGVKYVSKPSYIGQWEGPPLYSDHVKSRKY